MKYTHEMEIIGERIMLANNYRGTEIHKRNKFLWFRAQNYCSFEEWKPNWNEFGILFMRLGFLTSQFCISHFYWNWLLNANFLTVFCCWTFNTTILDFTLKTFFHIFQCFLICSLRNLCNWHIFLCRSLRNHKKAK